MSTSTEYEAGEFITAEDPNSSRSAFYRVLHDFDMAEYAQYGFRTEAEYAAEKAEFIESEIRYVQRRRSYLAAPEGKSDRHFAYIDATCERLENMLASNELIDEELSYLREWSYEHLLANLVRLGVIEPVEQRFIFLDYTPEWAENLEPQLRANDI